MHKIVATTILGAMLAAAQTQAPPQPTAAEFLQMGIYTQETAGDLDGAIKIYRQIVDSHPAQREIAAQAQYRLGLTLLAKGDANNASQEIQRLGWDYPDYKELIAAAKSASGPRPETLFITRPGEQAVRFTVQRDPIQPLSLYDLTQSTTVTGTVTQINMTNPNASLTIASPGNPASPIHIFVSSPSALAAQGWKEDTLKIGDQVTVVGAPARNTASLMQASSVSTNGVGLWSASQGPKNTAAREQLAKADLEKEFDFTQSTKVTGTVTQIQMMNPASWLTITSPGTLAPPIRVRVSSTNALAPQGWKRETLKIGDQVTIVGAPARDGSSIIQAISVLAYGGELWSIAMK